MFQPNGPEGSLKGHVFDALDLSSLPHYVTVMTDPARVLREVAALNERYRIVAHCPTCNRALIAEEHLAHLMKHVPSRSRALVRTLIATSPEIRKEVLAAVADLEGIA